MGLNLREELQRKVRVKGLRTFAKSRKLASEG